MRLTDPTPENSAASNGADTPLSPGFRPEVMVGPEHEQRRRAVEAALFGGAAEAASFGRYRLLHRIGEGGMGSVYAAYDDHLDRKIAVKLIRPGKLDSAEMRERTLREARALARLSHPNVVHVYEVGEIEGQLFVAMEFLAGPTLRTWLDGQERPWREALAVLRQAGEGLAAAHAQGIVHRDFKPHNAMFGADGRVRVLDFGLARLGEVEEPAADAAAGTVARADPALTMTGTLLGTPAYMAPEQFQRRRADARSDQFTFCVALYEALYGKRPFAGATLAELAEAITTGRVAARPKDSRVPQWVHAALLRGLQTDPAQRWPSMRELLAALERDPGARLRRIAASAALVAATGGASFALAGSNGAAIAQCPDARAELAQIWDGARAEAVREDVRAKHPAAADEVLALALPLIERYAGEWVHMRNDACRAHAEGRQSSHVFDLRTACLDQRRAGLDALVRALEMADAAQIHDIPGAAAGLPTLERCADTRALTAAVAPPEDERLQARVQRHRERLAEAQVHEDAGSIRRGLEIVDEVLADTEAIAYEPLLAEAYLRKGALELESFANPAALESLDRALWTALAVGHAPVAAQASAKRGFVLGNRLEQHERARAELPVMAALNRRAQDDVDLYAEYLHIVGAMYKQANDLPSARTALESARALREKRGRGETLKQLGTLISLALLDGVERQLDDIDEHFRQFRVVAAKIAAPGARYHIFGEANFALSRTALGRPREAHELLGVLQDRISKLDDDSLRALILAALIQTALVDEDFRAARRLLTLDASVISRHNAPQYTWEMREMLTAAAEGDASAMQAHYEAMQAQLEASGMQDTMNLLYAEQGRALEMLGRLGEAVESFERLQSKFAEASTTPDIWSGVQASLNLGRLRRKLGDYELAERELERALRELERIAPVRNFDHAAIFKERGELAHERQHVDAAVAYLTEAESLFETTAEPDYLPLVRTRFVLAQALTGDGPASPAARARAEAALEAFRAKNRDDEARAVEAWLAEHA